MRNYITKTQAHVILGLLSLIFIVALALFNAFDGFGPEVDNVQVLIAAFGDIFSQTLVSISAGVFLTSIVYYVLEKHYEDDNAINLLIRKAKDEYKPVLQDALTDLVGRKLLNPMHLSYFSQYYIEENNPILTQDEISKIYYESSQPHS